MPSKHKQIEVKPGQVWERKSGAIRITIIKGRGDEFLCERVGNGKITHHIDRFILHKYWKLIPPEELKEVEIIKPTMSKLLLLKGLPASGKSTRAKEIVDTGNYIRVNRDLLRTMLHFDKWSGNNEGMTVEAEKSIAANALANGINVVVDDCNLNNGNADMWKEVAKAFEASFQVEKMKTSMEECLERDLGREKPLGRHVIINMALQYGLYPKPAKGLILCDLDGTLCDIKHRLHFVKGETKNWKAFFKAMPDDELRLDTVDKLLTFEEMGHEIIFVSARPETYRQETEAWLEKKMKGYPLHKTLIMRNSKDMRDDVEVKEQFYDKFFKGKYPIEAVIDDRPKVIRMWQSLGLNVIDVGEGVEF